jgi:IS1 family transposase
MRRPTIAGFLITDIKSRRIQCDEIWSFVYAKAKNVPADHAGEWGYGDVWTWIAIDADTKLIPSWAVGHRDGFTAAAFIRDLADRLATRVQLTTDGLKVYLEAVEGAFGNDIDYAMLVKMYQGQRQEHVSRAALQSCRLHGFARADDHRQPRRCAYFHVLRRAAEPHDADEHPPLHAADERVLKEGRPSRVDPLRGAC